MSEIQSFYRFRMTFSPPDGEPVTQSLDAVNTLLLLDAIRRADRHVGRPTTPRDMRLRKLVEARDQIRGEVTQEALAEAMGFDARTIRNWLTDLKMTWQQFLDF
jgi:hypothetical protein